MWLNSSGFVANSWNEADGNRARIFELENYVRNAEIARRGCVDAIFFADQPQLTPDPKVRREYPFEPIVLAAAITARVPDIGAIATASTSFSLPCKLARQVASANLLSGGRIGWNAVTTANPFVAQDYGATLAPRNSSKSSRPCGAAGNSPGTMPPARPTTPPARSRPSIMMARSSRFAAPSACPCPLTASRSSRRQAARPRASGLGRGPINGIPCSRAL